MPSSSCAGFGVSSGDQGVTVNLTAERDTPLPALALVATLMREPSLPQEAFDRLLKAGIAGMEASRKGARDPAARGRARPLQPGAWAEPGPPGLLDGLDERLAQQQRMTLADVRGFHADYWSANKLRVTAVGALPEQLDAAVEQFFGNWKKPAAPAFVRHPAVQRRCRLRVLMPLRATSPMPSCTLSSSWH